MASKQGLREKASAPQTQSLASSIFLFFIWETYQYFAIQIWVDLFHMAFIVNKYKSSSQLLQTHVIHKGFLQGTSEVQYCKEIGGPESGATLLQPFHRFLKNYIIDQLISLMWITGSHEPINQQRIGVSQVIYMIISLGFNSCFGILPGPQTARHILVSDKIYGERDVRVRLCFTSQTGDAYIVFGFPIKTAFQMLC